MMWGEDERRGTRGRTLEGNQPFRGTDQILRPNLTGADLEARGAWVNMITRKGHEQYRKRASLLVA
jgi:hypothetical protein